MRKIIILLTICIFALSLSVQAADDPLIVPHVFENGEVADADQMNQMFTAIQEILNKNLVVMYDYGAPPNSVKVFEHTNSPTTLTAIITKPGIETWSFSDGSKVEYLTSESAEGTMDIGRRMYNTSGILTQNLTYFPAVLGVKISGSKSIGKIWGNAYIAKKPDGSRYGAEVNMYSIIGIEDVTVPAGTFLNCIKVFHTTGNYKNVAWYAEGVGLIKRIGVNGLMELK